MWIIYWSMDGTTWASWHSVMLLTESAMSKEEFLQWYDNTIQQDEFIPQNRSRSIPFICSTWMAMSHRSSGRTTWPNYSTCRWWISFICSIQTVIGRLWHWSLRRWSSRSTYRLHLWPSVRWLQRHEWRGGMWMIRMRTTIPRNNTTWSIIRWSLLGKKNRCWHNSKCLETWFCLCRRALVVHWNVLCRGPNDRTRSLDWSYLNYKWQRICDSQVQALPLTSKDLEEGCVVL